MNNQGPTPPTPPTTPPAAPPTTPGTTPPAAPPPGTTPPPGKQNQEDNVDKTLQEALRKVQELEAQIAKREKEELESQGKYKELYEKAIKEGEAYEKRINEIQKSIRIKQVASEYLNSDVIDDVVSVNLEKFEYKNGEFDKDPAKFFEDLVKNKPLYGKGKKVDFNIPGSPPPASVKKGVITREQLRSSLPSQRGELLKNNQLVD